MEPYAHSTALKGGETGEDNVEDIISELYSSLEGDMEGAGAEEHQAESSLFASFHYPNLCHGMLIQQPQRLKH